MTTTANAKIEAISAIAEQMFGAGDQLDQFKLRLMAEIFAKQSTTKTNVSANKPKKIPAKKSSNPENQCGAYIFALVMNEETGEMEPKQCSLSHEKDEKYCKKHGAVHGKHDEAASNYHGKDVSYDFKWELCGSVESGPTFVFDKFKDQLVAKFNQASGSEASGNESDDSAPKKKETKKTSPATKKEKKLKATKEPKTKTATKRPKNPYFEYLSAERESIKADLMSENSELKGRDLATSITKEAGKRWNAMSAEEKQPYIDVVEMNADIDMKGSDDVQDSTSSSINQEVDAAAIQPCCDDHAQEEMEEEETDRIFNETHGVWVDPETQLYYETEESESPIGQVVRGKTIPFKTKKQ